MKYLVFILVLIAGCAKEPEIVRTVQLSVEGGGEYLVNYGTSNYTICKGENKWCATLSAIPGDNIKLSVRTYESPATLYMSIELKEGLLYCRSLYIEPHSTGTLNHILTP